MPRGVEVGVKGRVTQTGVHIPFENERQSFTKPEQVVFKLN